LRRGVYGRQRNRGAVAQHKDGRLSNYLSPLEGHASPEVRSQGSNEFGDALATGNWDPRCAHKSTAIRVRRNIFSEQILQCSHISLLSGVDERLEKATLLRCVDRRAPAIGDVFTGTGHQLADVCFLHLQDIIQATGGNKVILIDPNGATVSTRPNSKEKAIVQEHLGRCSEHLRKAVAYISGTQGTPQEKLRNMVAKTGFGGMAEYDFPKRRLIDDFQAIADQMSKDTESRLDSISTMCDERARRVIEQI
jgi:hypothetical protein